MPKPKRLSSGKSSTKQKLSPEERSQIAKDRWAKRRERLEAIENTPAAQEEAIQAGSPPPTPPNQPPYPQKPQPEQPPAAPESITSGNPENLVAFSPEPSAGLWELGQDGNVVHRHVQGEELEKLRPSMSPIPASSPPAPKKQKRIPQPKEFSSALKAAESRLAKAITERAEYAGKLAALQAEIPSLLGIINALKGSGNYASPTAYDFPGNIPSAPAFQSPIPQVPQAPMDLQTILQAAQPQPPVYRSAHAPVGGAMQFSPDVVGTLEGPEDDDPDRFIRGEHAGNAGWIGG